MELETLYFYTTLFLAVILLGVFIFRLINTKENRNHNQIVRDIYEKLGQASATTDQITALNNSFSSFKEMFVAPQMRGGIGELSCEKILSAVFPKSEIVKKQYSFNNNDKVDFLLQLGDMNIPIDAKFPLSQKSRSLEKAVEGYITNMKKYIKPMEDTTEYAILFIPNDELYTRLINESEGQILNFAAKNRIAISSPCLLYAQLLSLRQGFNGFRISKNIDKVLKAFSTISCHFEQLLKDMSTTMTHFQNGLNKYKEISDQARNIEEEFKSIVDEVNEKSELTN